MIEVVVDRLDGSVVTVWARGTHEATYDADAGAVYVRVSRERAARQIVLDDSRILDYAPDGSLVGVEILSPDIGLDLTDVPEAEVVARALGGHGFLVRPPSA